MSYQLYLLTSESGRVFSLLNKQLPPVFLLCPAQNHDAISTGRIPARPTRLRLGLNNTPELDQIYWPNTGCRQCHHWTDINCLSKRNKPGRHLFEVLVEGLSRIGLPTLPSKSQNLFGWRSPFCLPAMCPSQDRPLSITPSPAQIWQLSTGQNLF